MLSVYVENEIIEYEGIVLEGEYEETFHWLFSSAEEPELPNFDGLDSDFKVKLETHASTKHVKVDDSIITWKDQCFSFLHFVI